MSPENMWRWAQLKGIAVIGTGDFTHPQWTGELGQKLEPAGNGLFRLKKDFQSHGVPATCRSDVFFLLTAEISCIYRKAGKTRKVHVLLLVPDFAGVEKISSVLSDIGNIASDGRPMLGMDAKQLLRIVLERVPDALIVPAHVWTPHFSVFGAVSGFDSLEECFEELTSSVHAIETGLSSDPPMNWRLTALDQLTLISNSDAHSPARIGREASIFEAELSYRAIMEAIRTRRGFAGTVEFFPEEGKYHNDGHRTCGISMTPRETVGRKYLCPACGRKVTVGVMHRIESLADRSEGFKPEGSPAFHSVVPLQEIIAETMGMGPGSKAVEKAYASLLEVLGNEFRVLMDTPLEDIERAGSPLLRNAVERVRSGNIGIVPGFDGEYGKVRIFETGGRKDAKRERAPS